MSPSLVAALGPQLLPLAHEHTNDLNRARYLVHLVVQRLLSTPRSGSGHLRLDDARALMADVARRENGLN